MCFTGGEAGLKRIFVEEGLEIAVPLFENFRRFLVFVAHCGEQCFCFEV